MFGKSLAHIEKIKSVNPINGADNIERVTVLDWNLIAKKGDFKEGDLALYVEIGSILPDGLSTEDKAAYDELDKIRSVHKSRENAIKKAKDKGTEIPVFDDDLEPLDEVERKIAEIQKRSKYPAFEGLRSRNFKVKTLVLNKFDVISQGILFNPAELGIDPSDVKVGADFTEFLGITEVMEDAEEAGVAGQDTSNPVRCLSRSLEKLACADIVWFAPGWECANGCTIEHEVAKRYLGDKIIIEEKTK